MTSLDVYDAAILGSAVDAGHWMKPMMDLVNRLEDDLAGRPVWLFSSGPIGDPAKPDEDPVASVMERTAARDHFLFAGKLDRKKLNFGERAIVGSLRAPEGDFRDWDQICDRAVAIAEELKTRV